MRAFIAVDLPEEVKEELLRVQQELPGAGIRAVRKNQMHLTMKFLGEITPAKADVVKAALRKIRFKPFKTCLVGVRVFPSENYVRVVWVGLEPEEEITALQKKIDCALEKDFLKDKKFKAHLTLARVKFVDDKKNFVEKIKKIAVKRVCFWVKDFRLKKSTLTRTGPIYEDLEVF
jgi:2'-5' RNA ligase